MQLNFLFEVIIKQASESETPFQATNRGIRPSWRALPDASIQPQVLSDTHQTDTNIIPRKTF